jgi:hypothetical protein
MKENDKRTMTLNLTVREMAVLEALAAKKELNKTGVVKLALRLLQVVDGKAKLGHKLMVENEQTQEKTELVFL